MEEKYVAASVALHPDSTKECLNTVADFMCKIFTLINVIIVVRLNCIMVKLQVFNLMWSPTSLSPHTGGV